MSILQADQALPKWATSIRGSERLVAISPSFGHFSRERTTWDALRDLFLASERLASGLPMPVARDQGTILALVRDDSEALALRAAVTHSNRANFGPNFYAGVSWLDEILERCTDLEPSSSLQIAAYAARQAVRLIKRSKWEEWGDARALPAAFKGASTVQDIENILYAIACGGRANRSVGTLDDLELWARVESSTSQANYLVMSDIHDTRSVLSPDLHDIAADYLDGKLGFEGLTAEGLRIRQSHNRIIEEHLLFLRGTSDLLFRASGDGIIGFAQSVEELQLRSESVSGRLRSGVAAVRFDADLSSVVRRLEFAGLITKLLKGTSAAEGTFLLLDEALSEDVIGALLIALQQQTPTVQAAGQYADLWNQFAPRLAQ